MTDDEQGELNGVLGRSLSVLREAVPVRDDWRAALLDRVAADRLERRGWRVHPSMAIAAGIAVLVAGIAIGRYVRPSPAAVTATSSVSPSMANVRFVLVAPGANHVAVVGDFNGWNAAAMPLRKLADGTWIVDVPLQPGRYAYAFVVDGKIQVDPSAPRAEGDFGENSVLMVRGS